MSINPLEINFRHLNLWHSMWIWCFVYLFFSVNSVLVTVQVWHSRVNPSSYLKKSDNQGQHWYLPHMVPFSHKVPSYRLHLERTTPGTLFSATLRHHYFVQRSMWNISFGCQCVYCRHWSSLPERTGIQHTLNKIK